MKHRFITPAVALLIAVVTLASCGSSRTTTKRYPYPGSPYPYPEERYPQGYPYPDRYPDDRYPDRRYPDYGSTRHPRNLPPGHAKKKYGSRSARPYAPGQQKKYDRRYEEQKKYDAKAEQDRRERNYEYVQKYAKKKKQEQDSKKNK